MRAELVVLCRCCRQKWRTCTSGWTQRDRTRTMLRVPWITVFFHPRYCQCLDVSTVEVVLFACVCFVCLFAGLVRKSVNGYLRHFWRQETFCYKSCFFACVCLLGFCSQGLSKRWGRIFVTFFAARQCSVTVWSNVSVDDLSVSVSVCPVRCGKTADRIRMPFAIIGRMDPGMRHVVGFGDRSMGRGTFGGKFEARHYNQWGLYRICVRQYHDAALIRNYFGQTCYVHFVWHCEITSTHANSHRNYKVAPLTYTNQCMRVLHWNYCLSFCTLWVLCSLVYVLMSFCERFTVLCFQLIDKYL